MSPQCTSSPSSPARQRFALLVCEYPLGTSTILINLVHMLAHGGAQVDIYTDENSLSPPYAPTEAGVRLIAQPKLSSLPLRVLRRLRREGWKRGLGLSHDAQVARLSPEWAEFGLWVARQMAHAPAYDAVFFASYPALFSAHHLSTALRRVYLNLELLDNSDGQQEYIDKALCRSLEHAQLPHVERILSTSPRRAEILQQVTGLPAERIRVLPVLPLAGIKPPKGDFFRKKFGISDDVRIVLYSGGIGSWGLHREIVETVFRWPQKVALVVHTWAPNSLENEYGLRLQAGAQGLPVHFSTEPLAYDKLITAIASADVGLAFYASLDQNMSEILFSSNKIAEYLRCGLPVICSDHPSLKNFFDQHRAGFATPVEGIPQALETLFGDYPKYSARARSCVESGLSFEQYFAAALEGILSPVGQP